jgi:glycosyltransferase involved in cell wall biosynthesis
MTRLLYISHTDMRSGQVTAIQIMNTCAALSSAGADVTLLDYYHLPFGGQRIVGDYWEYYGLQPSFRRVTLPTVLYRGAARMPGLTATLKAVPMSVFCAWLLARRPFSPETVVYGRCYTGMLALAQIRALWPTQNRPKLIFEAHENLTAGQRAVALRKMDGVVCISNALRRDLINGVGLAPHRTIVEYDAVDFDKFSPKPNISQADLRRELGLPVDSKIVCYAGGLYTEEISLLRQAARQIEENIVIVVVGGSQSEVEQNRCQTVDSRIRFVGHVAHAEVPRYLQAADVLVMPYTNHLPWSAYFSPVKLFEYMAAQRPIISSDLPALRETLRPDENALLIRPGSVRDLLRAISFVLDNPNYAARIVRTAAQEVKEHTWTRRAERILEFSHAVQAISNHVVLELDKHTPSDEPKLLAGGKRSI